LQAEPKRVKFPSGNERANFESNCNNLFKPKAWECDHWILMRMKSFEVFPGGCGELLYLLTDLDNTNKHRSLVSTVRAVAHPIVKIRHPAGGGFESYGNVGIGFDDFTLGYVPPGSEAEVHGHESIPVQVSFRGVPQIGMIALLLAMEREVLFHIHVLETLLEASPRIVLPLDD
jgi:hypothetical protein